MTKGKGFVKTVMKTTMAGITVLMLFSGLAAAATYTELNVPMYQQDGGQSWSSDQLGSCTPKNVYNIANYGCAISSLAMMFKYYGIDTDPQDMNNWMIDNDYYGYDGCSITDWEVIEQKSKGIVKWIDSYPTDLTQIRSEIDQGHPVIADVRIKKKDGTYGQHFVVVTNYSDTKFGVNDPVGGLAITIPGNRYPGKPEKEIKSIRLYRGPTITIVDQSVFPTTVNQGDESTFTFRINNPYPYQVGLLLGAQIKKDDKKSKWQEIAGETLLENKIIYLLSGTHEYTRKFTIPIWMESGSYDVKWMTRNFQTEDWIFSRVVKNTLTVEVPKTPIPPKPIITVITPDNGNVWKAGSFQFIKWTFSGNPGPIVKIELLKNGQIIKTIGTSLIIDGFYLWPIPNDLTLGENYQIKISSVSYPEYTDTSDGYFALGELNVVLPNGGENWQISNSLWNVYNIQWKYTGNLGPDFKIELLNSCACTSVYVIEPKAPLGSNGQGSYAWAVPMDISSGEYIIKVISNSHPEFSDTSDGHFTIKAAPVISAINVSPAAAIVQLDETQVFTAIASDQYGNPIEAAISWSVENATVGSINATGFFIAAANGSTKVIASSGSISGNATVNVTLPPLPLNGKYANIQDQIWVWVPAVQIWAYGTLYPIYAYPSDGSFLMDTPLGSESYIEKKFYVPLDATNLSARIWGAKNMDGASWCGQPATTTISLTDSGNAMYELDKFTPIQMDNGVGDGIGPKNYSLNPYKGQTVKIRIDQTSGYGHCTYGYYKDIGIQTN